MKSRKTLGATLVKAGLIVGGITGVCFVLLMGIAVGAGMGGGLRNGREIMFTIQLFGILSAISLVLGIILCAMNQKN